MSDLEKTLKDVVYAGIGAVSTLVEKGSEVAQTLVEKGQTTVSQNKAMGEELKRKAKETIDQMTDIQVDVSKMTPQQRDELRRQLDLIEKEEKGEDAHDGDEQA